MDVVFFDGTRFSRMSRLCDANGRLFSAIISVPTLLHSFSSDLHIICILVCTTTWTFICKLYEKAFTGSLGTIEWSMQLSLRLHLLRPRTYWQSGQVWAGALACLLHPRINTSNCHFARQTDGFTHEFKLDSYEYSCYFDEQDVAPGCHRFRQLFIQN